MAVNQFAAGDLAESQVGQFRLRQTAGVLPHDGNRFFPEQVQRRIEDALAVRMDRRMKHRPVHEHDVARDLLDFQVGPKFLLAIRQYRVDLVQTLGVAVADFKQGHAVHEGVHPHNLIDGELADDVLVEGVLVVAADADLQVPDVIVQVRPGDRGAKFAVQSHESLQGPLPIGHPPLRRQSFAFFCGNVSSSGDHGLPFLPEGLAAYSTISIWLGSFTSSM